MKIVSTFPVLPICGPARLPERILNPSDGRFYVKDDDPIRDAMTAGTRSPLPTLSLSVRYGMRVPLDQIRELLHKGDVASLEVKGESAVPFIAGYLNSEHFETAAEALGKIGGESARDVLIAAALKDLNREEVRVAAIQALGKIGDALAKKVLIALLEHESTQPHENDANVEIRKATTRVAGEIGGAWAEKVLIKLLEDNSPDIRIVVLEALAPMIDNPDVRTVVIERADPDNEKIPAVRGQAIASLGESKEPRAVVDVVIKALIDHDWLVAPQAREILVNWGSEVRDVLSEFHGDKSNDPKLREEVAAILAAIQKEIDASSRPAP